MGNRTTHDGSVLYRDATHQDLTVLVDIYNHYVATSHATFDLVPKTVDDRRDWLNGFSPNGRHRLMVAETDGRVVGYACSAQFRSKPAYSKSVETTVYLDPKYTGRGIGFGLYGVLLDWLGRRDDVHQAYAGIAIPNASSIALHEKLGFELVGTFRDAGFKFDKYWSVSWFQKTCQPG